MLNELRKVVAFIKRDFRIIRSYRLGFSTAFLNLIFSFFYIILFGSMFGDRLLPVLAPYGGDFISYILVGSIGWGYLWGIMDTTSTSLMYEMMAGTIESVLLTPTRFSTMMLSYMIFGCAFSLISLSFLIPIGFFCFGASLGNATLYTFLIMLLSTVMMMGLGMIFGGITIVVKNTGPVLSLTQSVAMFFCGVYFPASILPEYLQSVAYFLPFYYSMEGLRKSLIATTPVKEILGYIWILLAFASAFILLGLYIPNKCIMKAKKDGSLAFY